MPRRPVSRFDEIIERPGYPGREWMALYLRWVEEDRDDLRASSRRAYEAAWRTFLVFLAERGRTPTAASSVDASDFLQRYKQATALRYGRLLERVYALQVSRHAIGHNPFSHLSLLTAEEERPPSVALKLPTVEELIQSFPEPEDWQAHRDQAAAVLAASAGLRFRELRELTLQQLTERSKGMEVQVRGRTAHSREVLLEPAAARFIKGWLEIHSELPFRTKLAFPGRRGQRIPANTLYRRLRALLEAIYGKEALPHFGIGVLRGRFALTFQAKDEVVEAQHALGHRRLTSTLRYLRHLKPIAPNSTS